MHEKEHNALTRLARSWNDLDTLHISSLLAQDVIYESQWTLVPIVGRHEVLNHLNNKFSALREASYSTTLSLEAFVGFHPKLNFRPCLIIKQVIGSKSSAVTVLIKVGNGFIQRIDVCFNPDPAEALRQPNKTNEKS